MAALFVRNLHPGVAEWTISERFSPAGHVESVHICRDRKTGASLGYAYVNFRHRHQAERALEMFNFEPLLDRPMHVMWSDREPAAKRTIQSAAAAIERRNGMMLNDREVTIKAEDRPSSQHHASNLFIKNLNSTIDDECLRMVFGQFGRVTSAKEEQWIVDFSARVSVHFKVYILLPVQFTWRGITCRLEHGSCNEPAGETALRKIVQGLGAVKTMDQGRTDEVKRLQDKEDETGRSSSELQKQASRQEEPNHANPKLIAVQQLTNKTLRFQEKWYHEFPWLRYSPGVSGIL
ncbi:hypothetical protein KOW79_016001 [Hemibagrus wyckioides]|uniref:RRM domain-containing protein n=1 Tax=Hemibagrus wyckioides TaxID=337641 RepID=A0A9D3SI13_9TELE|nr:hypothetical protein KOW79_016001 [Hemibagrus wyckioides]